MEIDFSKAENVSCAVRSNRELLFKGLVREKDRYSHLNTAETAYIFLSIVYLQRHEYIIFFCLYLVFFYKKKGNKLRDCDFFVRSSYTLQFS